MKTWDEVGVLGVYGGDRGAHWFESTQELRWECGIGTPVNHGGPVYQDAALL